MILCRAVIIKPAVGLLLIATSDLFQPVLAPGYCRYRCRPWGRFGGSRNSEGARDEVIGIISRSE